MMCIIATVSMVESTGVYLALSDLTGENLTVNASAMVTVQKVQLFYSVVVFNTFPYTGFSQNVGLVRISGI